ncbi:unnamed protein product [Lactuca saligna]|uniref:Uncharacterized protein n=1 Tax=Lactuca saligna TaxID=75948 RepID=A0AA35VGN4_LACSI|nr:unnamed protein product [Lactuca saligna]
MVHHVACHEKQTKIKIRHLMEIGATSQVNYVRIRRIDEDHDRTQDHTKFLRREMATTRTKVQELREHRTTLEERLTEAERQAAKSRAEMRETRNFVSSLRDPQSFNRRK